MASLVSKKFVIGLANFSEPTHRAARRVIINADVVKAVKLCAGDVVALSDSDNVDNTKVSTQWFQRFCLRETLHSHVVPESDHLIGLRCGNRMALPRCVTGQ